MIISKIRTIDVKNAIVSITKIEEEYYICLTDMAKAKNALKAMKKLADDIYIEQLKKPNR